MKSLISYYSLTTTYFLISENLKNSYYENTKDVLEFLVEK